MDEWFVIDSDVAMLRNEVDFRTKEYILNLCKVCVEQNYFKFDNKYFEAKGG